MGAPAYALPDQALLAECTRDRLTTGGPGGQHAARRATAVRLTHRPTGIAIACDTHRDGAANQRAALTRLRLALAIRLRGGADPTWLFERRRGSRLPVGATAVGYHLVVAVLLDALTAHAGRLAETAAACGISSSQLARVLCADGAVRAAADVVRSGHGLSPLKP